MYQAPITTDSIKQIYVRMDDLIEQIQQQEGEQKDLLDIYNAKIAALDFLYKEKNEKIESNINYMKAELMALFDRVPKKETKTQQKVKLLCGDVIVKKPTIKFSHDDKKLLEWAKENDKEELIKTKESSSFDWAAFREQLALTSDNQILDNETGEVLQLDGLSLEQTPEKLVIKYYKEDIDNE